MLHRSKYRKKYRGQKPRSYADALFSISTLPLSYLPQRWWVPSTASSHTRINAATTSQPVVTTTAASIPKVITAAAAATAPVTTTVNAETIAKPPIPATLSPLQAKTLTSPEYHYLSELLNLCSIRKIANFPLENRVTIATLLVLSTHEEYTGDFRFKSERLERSRLLKILCAACWNEKTHKISESVIQLPEQLFLITEFVYQTYFLLKTISRTKSSNDPWESVIFESALTSPLINEYVMQLVYYLASCQASHFLRDIYEYEHKLSPSSPTKEQMIQIRADYYTQQTPTNKPKIFTFSRLDPEKKEYLRFTNCIQEIKNKLDKWNLAQAKINEVKMISAAAAASPLPDLSSKNRKKDSQLKKIVTEQKPAVIVSHKKNEVANAGKELKSLIKNLSDIRQEFKKCFERIAPVIAHKKTIEWISREPKIYEQFPSTESATIIAERCSSIAISDNVQNLEAALEEAKKEKIVLQENIYSLSNTLKIFETDVDKIIIFQNKQKEVEFPSKDKRKKTAQAKMIKEVNFTHSLSSPEENPAPKAEKADEIKPAKKIAAKKSIPRSDTVHSEKKRNSTPSGTTSTTTVTVAFCPEELKVVKVAAAAAAVPCAPPAAAVAGVPAKKRDLKLFRPASQLKLHHILAHIVKISYIIATKTPDKENDLENEIIHFALLYHIFRVFEGLKQLAHRKITTPDTLDRESIIELRNILMHHGFDKASYSAVFLTAQTLISGLPQELAKLKAAKTKKAALVYENSILTAKDAAIINGICMLKLEEKASSGSSIEYKSLPETPLYRELANWHASLETTDIEDSARIAQLDKLVDSIQRIFTTIAKVHRTAPTLPKKKEEFEENYSIHLAAIKILIAMCGEIYLPEISKQHHCHAFWQESRGIRNKIAHEFNKSEGGLSEEDVSLATIWRVCKSIPNELKPILRAMSI